MKEYLVSLTFVTRPEVEENLLLSLLGLSDVVLTKKNTGNIWMLESNLDQDHPLEEHVSYLYSLFEYNKIAISNAEIESVHLDIGVMYDTLTCTVCLSGSLIKEMTTLFPNLKIQLTCYPSSDE